MKGPEGPRDAVGKSRVAWKEVWKKFSRVQDSGLVVGTWVGGLGWGIGLKSGLLRVAGNLGCGGLKLELWPTF